MTCECPNPCFRDCGCECHEPSARTIAEDLVSKHTCHISSHDACGLPFCTECGHDVVAIIAAAIEAVQKGDLK